MVRHGLSLRPSLPLSPRRASTKNAAPSARGRLDGTGALRRGGCDSGLSPVSSGVPEALRATPTQHSSNQGAVRMGYVPVHKTSCVSGFGSRGAYHVANPSPQPLPATERGELDRQPFLLLPLRCGEGLGGGVCY